MGKFAKIFDVDSGENQLVVMLTTNDDEDPCVKYITVIDGIEAAINHTVENPETMYDRLQARFNATNQDVAEKLYQEIKQFIDTPSGPSLTCASCGKETRSLKPFCEECE